MRTIEGYVRGPSEKRFRDSSLAPGGTGVIYHISVNYFAGEISAPQDLHRTVSLLLLGGTI